MHGVRRVVGVRRPVILTAAARVEQDPGNSEDARPLIVPIPEGVALAVFDGMGGAGASRHVDGEGRERTEAYISARACRATVAGLVQERGIRAHDRHELERMLTRTLAKLLKETGAATTALRSKLLRRFPTTAALAFLSPSPVGMTVCAMWAGDSRVYLITPTQGLVQVSRDDVKGDGDAMSIILSDPPLSHCISADAPVALHEHSVDAIGSALVLAATDGCFAYLPSPWHFEYLVLSCLEGADTSEDFGEALQAALAEHAQDDATIAIAAIGFEDIRKASRAFTARRRMLARHLVGPLEVRDARVRKADEALADAQRLRAVAVAERDALRDRLWDRYRLDYEYVLPNLEEEHEHVEGR